MMKNKIGRIFAAVSAFIMLSAATVFPVYAEGEGTSSIEGTLDDGMFKYELLADDTYTIIGYSAASISSIPSTRNGKAVTAISDSAFMGCTAFTDLVIPDSIRSIGTGAFLGSTIKSVTLPRNLETFGENVFADCSLMTSVTIPKGLTQIPDYTFLRCGYLTDLTLPDTIETIGDGAFYECSSLTVFDVPASLKSVGELAFGEWFSIKEINTDGCANFVCDGGILYNSDKSAVYRAVTTLAGDINVPEKVTTIKSGAFSACDKIEHLFLPSSLAVIETGAFSYCPSIKSIDFSEGLTSIGEGAFMFDESLSTVSLPTTATEIGPQAFAYCTSLDKLILPEGAEKIGEMAFLYCNSLKRVSIPKSVKEIGNNAFGYTVENSELASVNDFSMSVFSGLAGEKYAKSNKIEYTTVDHNIMKIVFIVIGFGAIAAVIVFASVLMARNRKTAPLSAKKAQKEAKEKELEESYEKILDDGENNEEDDDSEEKSESD